MRHDGHDASSVDVTASGDRLEERVLLARLHRRDEDAFRELVGRYGPTVRAYAAGMLGNAHDADDAAQECFLRAYRRVLAFRGDSTLLTWLLRICRNHCVDRLRARRTDTVELDPQIAAEASTPALAAVSFDRERLLLGIARLPDAQQQVLVLRELRGLSYDETACALGIPVGTMRSRLHEARRALRQHLETDAP